MKFNRIMLIILMLGIGLSCENSLVQPSDPMSGELDGITDIGDIPTADIAPWCGSDVVNYEFKVEHQYSPLYLIKQDSELEFFFKPTLTAGYNGYPLYEKVKLDKVEYYYVVWNTWYLIHTDYVGQVIDPVYPVQNTTTNDPDITQISGYWQGSYGHINYKAKILNCNLTYKAKAYFRIDQSVPNNNTGLCSPITFTVKPNPSVCPPPPPPPPDPCVECTIECSSYPDCDGLDGGL